ncbi:restriction endonuclease subunit S, partial [Flavobacteriaceae bacterium]|nr:restriction endonuclease subunit S [Flavobacteriaceae bacterium]
MGVENNIPEGWMETTLGEIALIGSSKRIFFSEYVDKGIPFYRSKEIIQKQKGNNISTELFITEEKYDNLKKNFGAPQENDILLTSVGTLGIPYRVKKDEIFYFKDGNLTWFRDYQNIESAFLYNWFLSSNGKHQLNKITIGSTQSAITISGLKSIEILLPPINEQIEITNLINAFDEKIELLQAQNKTLETMAQTIFKEWFGKYQVGDELPEGWKVGKLGDIAKHVKNNIKPFNNPNKLYH